MTITSMKVVQMCVTRDTTITNKSAKNIPWFKKILALNFEFMMNFMFLN